MAEVKDLEELKQEEAAPAMEEIPADRWDWQALWGDPKQGPSCDVKYGGFVVGHDLFDAGFFSLSPKEAELMDPQHRLFMECVWHLLDNAGYAPASARYRLVCHAKDGTGRTRFGQHIDHRRLLA